MSTVDLNASSIHPGLLKVYHQSLLSQALSEGIKRNEEQFKIWNEYKKRHMKVTEALEKIPLELSINCMIPVGKRALMKGKLVHTNEILACLGDGYFVKYSASQATALCNRRIQFAEEMLQTLEKERNLYEMRQFIPAEFDIFGTEERTDLVEHWDEKKLDDWRVEHRKKEREYHKKLSELRKKEKTEIHTEEDLLRRLDELELEEELSDEINRLEYEQSGLYGDELQEGEVYYESSEGDDTSSEEPTSEMIEKELEKLREIKKSRNIENKSISPVVESNEMYKEHEIENDISRNNITEVLPEKIENMLLETIVNDEPVKLDKSKSMNVTNEKEKVKYKKRISFAEPSVQETKSSVSLIKEEITQMKNQEGIGNNNKDDDDIIRIEFKHSDNNPCIEESSGTTITTPKDIYKLVLKPKSILERSANDLVPHQVIPSQIGSDTDEGDEDEDEDESNKPSAYNFVVKDIQEKEQSTSMQKTAEVTEEKRPISKFKMQRSVLKK